MGSDLYINSHKSQRQVAVMENAIVLKKKTRDGKTLINHNELTYKVKYEGSKSILY